MSTNHSPQMDKARSFYDTFMGALKWIVPLLAVITFFVVVAIAE